MDKAKQDGGDAQLGVFKRIVKEAQEMAGAQRTEGEGYALHSYPDYETYKAVQTAGNKAKIRRQFVKESHIKRLCDFLAGHLGTVNFGLCHGTRRGAEQAWFTANLANAPTVIGTEISDTAAQFPATVQWDFHDINPEWTGKADFVYSNSWDHAFDPQRAFSAWIDALRPGGLLLLDHTKDQSPETTNALDPFGATIEKLQSMFQENFAESGALLPTLDTRQTNPEYRARVVVFEKAK